MALYRAPGEETNSVLPYVYTVPKPDAVIRLGDKAYVYCNPMDFSQSLENALNLPLFMSEAGVLMMQEREVAQSEEEKLQANAKASRTRGGRKKAVVNFPTFVSTPTESASSAIEPR